MKIKNIYYPSTLIHKITKDKDNEKKDKLSLSSEHTVYKQIRFMECEMLNGGSIE